MINFLGHTHWGYLVIAAITSYFAFTGVMKGYMHVKSGIIKGKWARIYGYFFVLVTIGLIIFAFSPV